MEFEISLDYAIEDLEAYWRAFVWKKPGTPPQKQASPRMHRNAGLVFLALESVRRKRIPPEKEGYVHLVGITLLMALMVFVMFNDIRNIL